MARRSLAVDKRSLGLADPRRMGPTLGGHTQLKKRQAIAAMILVINRRLVKRILDKRSVPFTFIIMVWITTLVPPPLPLLVPTPPT
jgi:hypothetical protein